MKNGKHDAMIMFDTWKVEYAKIIEQFMLIYNKFIVLYSWIYTNKKQAFFYSFYLYQKQRVIVDNIHIFNTIFFF